MSSFAESLNEQVANEFAAHQQYVAIAVHYDSETLPRLSSFFYRQAVEERNHAMMITQYLLDADLPVATPGVAAPETSFADIVAPVELALAQEKRVTQQISALGGAAPATRATTRASSSCSGSSRSRSRRSRPCPTCSGSSSARRDNPLLAEEYLARESLGEGEWRRPDGPPAAGGAL